MLLEDAASSLASVEIKGIMRVGYESLSCIISVVHRQMNVNVI